MKIMSKLRDFLPKRFRESAPKVAVVRLTGAIGMSQPMGQSMTFAAVAPTLEKAFELKGAKAVAIIVNSPGGAPVQSHLIYQRIRALSEEKKLPVLAFTEDVAASGGYMIACAADEIYADPSSIVGSIGVVSAGFGFDRFIEKHGIERRVHTAGTSKAMLDPFRPEKPEDVEHLKKLQEHIHIFFKGLVRTSRKERLKADEETLFSGSFWAGEEALQLGLIDGIGDVRKITREKFGEKVKLKLFAQAKPSLLGRLFGRGGAAEAALIDPGAVISAIEERALWTRFGL